MRDNCRAGRVGGAVLGLAAIGLVLAGCGSPTATPVPAPSTTAAPTTTTPAKHARTGISGSITAENGANWTVTAKSGKQYTVIVGPDTHFGTEKAPATQQQFTVGEKVRVTGPIHGLSVTATRIAAPATPTNPAAPSAPSTSTPATTASPAATTV